MALIATLLFIAHFIHSPYPINSIKKFRENLFDLLLYFKIKKYKVEIDRDGKIFKIVSAGLNAVGHEDCFFIFSFEKYKFKGDKRGLYVVKISNESYKSIEIK